MADESKTRMTWWSSAAVASLAIALVGTACISRVTSPYEALREPWRSAGAMVCAQTQAGLGDVVLAILSHGAAQPGMAPLGISNSVCGPNEDPCLCGPRDVLIAVLAAACIEEGDGDYLLFEWDRENRSGDTSMIMNVGTLEVERVGDVENGCAALRIEVADNDTRSSFGELDRMCQADDLSAFRFGYGEPLPEE
jgi:hypothetical protein